MLGEAEVGRRQAVVRAQLGLRHAAGEHHVVEEPELGAELLAAGQVGLGVHRRADDDQPAVRVEPPVEVVGLDRGPRRACSGRPGPTKRRLRPAPVGLLERRGPAGGRTASQSTRIGRTPVRAEAGGLELPPVELGDAERELGHVPEPRELPAPAPAAVGDARVDADEVLRRGDVVVDDGAPVRQAREEAGDLGADGEVEEHHRVGRGHLAGSACRSGRPSGGSCGGTARTRRRRSPSSGGAAAAPGRGCRWRRPCRSSTRAGGRPGTGARHAEPGPEPAQDTPR